MTYNFRGAFTSNGAFNMLVKVRMMSNRKKAGNADERLVERKKGARLKNVKIEKKPTIA